MANRCSLMFVSRFAAIDRVPISKLCGANKLIENGTHVSSVVKMAKLLVIIFSKHFPVRFKSHSELMKVVGLLIRVVCK